jgi:hypothetical protein
MGTIQHGKQQLGRLDARLNGATESNIHPRVGTDSVDVVNSGNDNA